MIMIKKKSVDRTMGGAPSASGVPATSNTFNG